MVFYGVNSEGMGHATRARPVLEALGQRYEVHVFCGGRTRNFLRKHFPHVHSVWYVRLRYKDNRVNVKRTVFWSFLEGPWALLTGRFCDAAGVAQAAGGHHHGLRVSFRLGGHVDLHQGHHAGQPDAH